LTNKQNKGEKLKKSTIEDDLGLSPKIDYKSKDKDIEKIFKERQDDRLQLIEESIADIKQMIVARGDLHKEILKSLENVELYINNTMPKNEPVFGSMSDSRQDLIKELLKKKIELDELKINEKLNFWRDTALLKKELREHMKELRDMKSQTSMLDNVLEW
jgi:flavorubredoxin